MESYAIFPSLIVSYIIPSFIIFNLVTNEMIIMNLKDVWDDTIVYFSSLYSKGTKVVLIVLIEMNNVANKGHHLDKLANA